jgi:hypothetical protein
MVRTKHQIELKKFCLTVVMSKKKKKLKSVESELLDSQSPNKKVKTIEEMNATERILITSLGIEDTQETIVCEMSDSSIRTDSKLSLN